MDELGFYSVVFYFVFKLTCQLLMVDYTGKTVQQLQFIAKQKDLQGYSKLQKNQLITLLKSKDPYESMTVIKLKQEAKKTWYQRIFFIK
jgi:hypothetical protein